MSRAKPEPSGSPPDDLAPVLRGYARVSTDGQTLGPQVESLKAAGATKLYRETASGAERDRAQLAKLLKEVEEEQKELAKAEQEIDQEEETEKAGDAQKSSGKLVVAEEVEEGRLYSRSDFC